MEEQENNEIVKSQFNRQAQKFSEWEITQNKEYLEEYKNFIGVTMEDSVLDVACGTGELSIFLSPYVKSVTGIDFSEGMIEWAKRNAAIAGAENVLFLNDNVEKLPFEDESFSVVFSKSAFHHMVRSSRVFNDMARCCKPGGKISTQDIVRYDDNYVNDFFERFDKLVDRSHQQSLSSDEFIKYYKDNNIEILQKLEVDVKLHYKEYLGHAEQSEDEKEKIGELIDMGLQDERISPFFEYHNDDLFFIRKVFLVVGRK